MVKRQGFRKSYRIKPKKSIFHNRFFWLILLFLIVFGGVFYLATFSKYIQVKESQIYGNQKLAADEIKNIVNAQAKKKILFFQSKSIFLIDPKNIADNLLEKFPQIESVELKRKLPEMVLTVQIKERAAVGSLCKDAGCFLIDKNGVIFENIETAERPIIKFEKSKDINLFAGQKILDDEEMQALLKIKEVLTERIALEIDFFKLLDEDRLNAATKEGLNIYFNLKEDIDWQLTKLDLVLQEKIPAERRQELEYIDLRFSRVYYKFRD